MLFDEPHRNHSFPSSARSSFALGSSGAKVADLVEKQVPLLCRAKVPRLSLDARWKAPAMCEELGSSARSAGMARNLTAQSAPVRHSLVQHAGTDLLPEAVSRRAARSFARATTSSVRGTAIHLRLPAEERRTFPSFWSAGTSLRTASESAEADGVAVRERHRVGDAGTVHHVAWPGSCFSG